MVCEPQASRAHLAAGGLEGTAEAAEERTTVAQRWFVRATETVVPKTMSGRTTSLWIGPTTGDRSACQRSSMSTPGSAWRSWSIGNYGPQTSSRRWRDCSSGVGRSPGCRALVHRAREPVGERLLRELQRQASRRDAQQRDLLHPTGGGDPDRELAQRVQRGPSTRQPELQTTYTSDPNTNFSIRFGER